MKPHNLKTKIFLDSGDPAETKNILEVMGFLDGQTTNPSLVAKNPSIETKFEGGERLTTEELLSEYKTIISNIRDLLPQGSISIEVYADKRTKAQEMIEQGREMFSWIPSAQIKLPTTSEGIKAAQLLLKEGIQTNMTLVFTQEQGAALHKALNNKIAKGDVFISPFIGRLDDINLDGIDLIANIQNMYKQQNSKIEVLAASIRNIEHFLYLLYMQVDIITAPFKILKQWAEAGRPIPSEEDSAFKDQNTYFNSKGIHSNIMKDIDFVEFDFTKKWTDFDIQHELTDKGLQRFADDWNALIAKE